MARKSPLDDVVENRLGSCKTAPPARTASVDLRKYMIGSAPSVPQLSDKPNPPGSYIYADGHVATVSGFVDGLLKDVMERLGLCRRVPFGVDLSSDSRKLWFLGLESFGPSIPRELMEKIMSGDVRPAQSSTEKIEANARAGTPKSLE